MFIRKAQAGSAPGYTWERDGQVLEVDDWVAEQLLDIPRGGFSIAEAPAPEPSEAAVHDGGHVLSPDVIRDVVLDADEPEDDGDAPDDAPETEDQPKRKGGRPKLPRDADGKIIRTEVAE